MTSISIAFITGVLGPVLVILVKYFLDRRKPKPDIVKDTLKVGEQVNSKLDDIKDEVKADRVWIMQFHNGGHFYPTGKSIAKFSMIYETVSPGTSSAQTGFQGIPVNLFSKAINQLLDNDLIKIADIKDEEIATFGLKHVAEEYNCKSLYLFSIKTIDEKFIGILGVDFTKRKVNLDGVAIVHLEKYATAIGGVLMNHLNQ